MSIKRTKGTGKIGDLKDAVLNSQSLVMSETRARFQ